MLSRLKFLITLVLLFTFMNVSIVVEGTESRHPGRESSNSGEESRIEAVIRGAVADQSWMLSGSREELTENLGRYFEGVLLEELAGKSWEFIAGPTDWYSLTRVQWINILYNDGERAVAEASIGIEDVENGHNESGKALFTMARTGDGWRINYLSLDWNSQ